MKKFIILIFLIAISNLKAEIVLVRNGDNYNNYGIGAGLGYLMHPASFKQLPGVPNCCPEFKLGTGTNVALNALFGYYIDKFGIILKAGVNFSTGDFKSTQQELMGINGEPYLGEFEHKINIKLTQTIISAGLSYLIKDKYHITAGLGTNINVSSKYNQSEQITKPAGKATFLDSNGIDTKSAIRNQLSGKLPDLNLFSPFVYFSVGLELPVSKDKSKFLIPEILVTYSFLNTLKNTKWNIFEVRFGLSFVFSTAKFIEKEIITTNDNDSLKIKDELNKKELERLKAEQAKNLADKKALEDNLRKEREARARQDAEQALLEQEKHIAEMNELQKKQAAEQEEIELENSFNEKLCKHLVVLFSSTNKNEIIKVRDYLKKSGNKEIKEFNDPYKNVTLYQIKSRVFNSYKEVIEFRRKTVTDLNLEDVPKIKCDD